MAVLRNLLFAISTAATVANADNLKPCLQEAVNRVAFAGDLLYQAVDVEVYNLDYPVTPAAVAFPTTADEVSAIVKCAANNGYPVQAKSGGHSYGNYGLGGVDGAVAIDMKNFQQFSMNTTSWEAIIGSGTLLTDVTQRLHNAGGRAMSHGTSPQIGAGGHFTIGGLGPTARQFGMALDHVLEAQVVLANGSIVQASDTQNQDVFWAIKGAASGFGIVTEFKVRTEPEPGTAVQYEFSLKIGPTSERAALFKQWQAYVSNPDLTWKLASTLTLAVDSVIISGTYFGTKAEYDELDIGSQFPSANGSAVLFESWLGLVGEWAQEVALELGGGVPAHFYSKSTAMTAETLMDDETIDEFFEYVDNTAQGTLLWFLIFDFEGGYTNTIASDATSYAHRDALIWLQTYSINLLGDVTQTQIDFLDGVNNIATTDKAAYAAYPGYVDPRLSDGPEAYWGNNLPRLLRIKEEIDPNNVFRNPQSPSPAA